jgi:methylenetetrahydrofolate reductase (NADPH)
MAFKLPNPLNLPNPLSLLRGVTGVAGDAAEIRRLVETMSFELVPLKNLDAQMAFLPTGAHVSVSCSPTKGLAATQELTGKLNSLGHPALPHLAARLVTGPDHVREIAAWCRTNGLSEIFLVAGDGDTPAGPYPDVVSFLRDFLATDHGLTRIGVTAYPDGHSLIARPLLRTALREKQALLAEAGIAGFASTQMCLDAGQIKTWLTTERAEGLTLPVHLGIPGVIDRAKLLTMGMRLGIGSSMRYAKKNRGALGQLFSPLGYDPLQLLQPLSHSAQALGIESLHVFTFNNVDATALWRTKALETHKA